MEAGISRLACTAVRQRGSSVVLVVLLLLPLSGIGGQQPETKTWEANAELTSEATYTMEGVGAMQGVSFHDGKVYLYGDVHDAKPPVGVIREYTADYKPTGRVIWLRRHGETLIRHPTGLTWHTKWGVFLGDTVNGKGVIYRLDLEKAWTDGNLNDAVLDMMDDDVAVNGCRPEFVSVNGKDLIATADYGDLRPEIRLYDPEKMLAAKRTSAPGVTVHRVLCGPFNQNLHWDSKQGELTCVQNVIAGRGWRLDVLNLANAVADGRAWGPSVRVRILTYSQKDELEGFRPLDASRGLFVTSMSKNNFVVGLTRLK